LTQVAGLVERHAACTTSAESSSISPICGLLSIWAEKDVIEAAKTVGDCQEHEANADAENDTTLLHIKVDWLLKMGRFVADVKITRSELPSSENRAAWSKGTAGVKKRELTTTTSLVAAAYVSLAQSEKGLRVMV
jgi:hypothetical protein